MKPNPKDAPNDPETYGDMNELRFQLYFWANDKLVQNYQYEIRHEAIESALSIQRVLADLKYVGGIIESYALRVDDMKEDKTTYIRMQDMKVDTYEECLEQFYTDHPECHPDYPENQ